MARRLILVFIKAMTDLHCKFKPRQILVSLTAGTNRTAHRSVTVMDSTGAPNVIDDHYSRRQNRPRRHRD